MVHKKILAGKVLCYKKAMRRGRYRKNWLSPEECKTWSVTFAPKLKSLLQERQQLGLSDAEFVARYLEVGFATAGLLQKGSSWKLPLPLQTIATGPLHLWSETLFRGIPLSVNRSLLSWQQGLYPLHLCEHAPSTNEILDLQTRGERCVTCVTEEALLSTHILGERDPLSFVLHDLIHADHFFQDQTMAQVQVGFSRLMKALQDLSAIQDLLKQDEIFKHEFDYGSTDMNSHGAHLLKYLKAILAFALERQGIKDHSDWLSYLLQEALLSDSVIACFLRLNTTTETTNDFQALQNFLFEKGTLKRSATGQNQRHAGVLMGQNISI